MMKVDIPYASVEEFAAEVAQRWGERVVPTSSVLRLHPTVHDWVVANCAQNDRPRVWVFPISRGPATMEVLWESINRSELGR